MFVGVGIGVPQFRQFDEVPYVGLFDNYPGAAGFSVRLLNTSYSGALVRIRRSSDNSEDDFMPDSNNELSLTSRNLTDTTTLGDWITTDDGYIRTWYDQGGSSLDATQTTTGNQPQIVSGGSIITNEAGKPTVKFVDASGGAVQDVLSMPLWHTLAQSWVGVWAVYDKLNTGFYHPIFSGVSGLGLFVSHNDTNLSRAATGRAGLTVVNGTTTLTLNQTYLRYQYADRTNLRVYLDGSGTAEIDNADLNTDFKAISGYTIGNESAAGQGEMYISELIMYVSDQSSNRSAIESNINTYYGIY